MLASTLEHENSLFRVAMAASLWSRTRGDQAGAVYCGRTARTLSVCDRKWEVLEVVARRGAKHQFVRVERAVACAAERRTP